MKIERPRLLATWLVLSVIGSALIVGFINQHYYQQEPCPPGMTARERAADFPWLEVGIDRLVGVWTLPLGVITFVSLFGWCASWSELEHLGLSTSSAYLYPMCLYFLAIFLLPLLLGIGLALLSLAEGKHARNRKKVLFSFGAIAHNLFASVIFIFYLYDWFSVFGD